MESGEIINDRFRIESILTYSMGSNEYLATDITINKPVILEHFSNTILDHQETIKSINYQIQISKILGAPYFLDFIDSFTIGSNLFITWKYRDAQSITKNPSLRSISERDVCKITSRCIKAIDVAHQNGIIHGALSSDAILITPELEPIIIDFSVPGASLTTDPGSIEGISVYRCAAPELFDGKKIDESCDYYSIGKISEYLFSICKTKNMTSDRSLVNAKYIMNQLISNDRQIRLLAGEQLRDPNFLNELSTPIQGNESIVLTKKQIRSIKRNRIDNFRYNDKTRTVLGFSIRLIAILCGIAAIVYILSLFFKAS